MKNVIYYILSVKLEGTKRSYKTATKELAYQKMEQLLKSVRELENELMIEVKFSCKIEKYSESIEIEELENIREYE